MDKDIEYVMAVAKYRSISKAASALYISQPSLSHYITSLEKRLELTLFDRTLSGVVPTAAGEEYLRYAEQIQNMYREMNERMRLMKDEGMAQVDVCLPISMNLDIMDLQNKFYRKYPQCRLNITCAKSRVAYERVQSKACSFAAGPKPPEELQLHFDCYLKNVLFLVVPDIYDFSEYATELPGVDYPAIDLRKLSEIEVVLQAKTTNNRHRIEKIAAKYGLKLVPTMVVESTSSAIISAKQQLGCCFLGQSHRNHIRKDDPLTMYVIDAGNGEIEYSETGIFSLPGKRFSAQERMVYQLVAENLIKDRLI